MKELVSLGLALLVPLIGAAQTFEKLPEPESPMVIVLQGGAWYQVRQLEEQGPAFVYMEMGGSLISAPKQVVDVETTEAVNDALAGFTSYCQAEDEDRELILELAPGPEKLFASLADRFDRTCWLRLEQDRAAHRRATEIASRELTPKPVATPTQGTVWGAPSSYTPRVVTPTPRPRPPTKTPTLTPRQSAKTMIRVAMKEGFITKLDEYEMWVDPAIWHMMDYDQKEGFTIAAIIHTCDCTDVEKHVYLVRDRMTGKKLARWSAFGLKVY